MSLLPRPDYHIHPQSPARTVQWFEDAGCGARLMRLVRLKKEVDQDSEETKS